MLTVRSPGVLQMLAPPQALLSRGSRGLPRSSRVRQLGARFTCVRAAVLQPTDLDRRIASIAGPSLLALSLDPVLAAIDTAFVGQLPGTDALAAVGVSSAVFSLLFSSTNFFANAATPLVAAEPDRRRALRLGSQIVGLAIALGFVLLLSIEASAPTLVTLFGADSDSSFRDAALHFMRLRALSAPAVVSITALNGILRGVGDATSAVQAAAVSAAVNLALDLVLIFGLGLGVEGAAAATAVAETTGAVVLARAFLKEVSVAQEDDERRGEREGSEGEERQGEEGHKFQATAAATAVMSMVSMSDLEDIGRDLGPFFRASGATILRTLSLQVFLAGLTAYLGAMSPRPDLDLAANQVLLKLFLRMPYHAVSCHHMLCHIMP